MGAPPRPAPLSKNELSSPLPTHQNESVTLHETTTLPRPIHLRRSTPATQNPTQNIIDHYHSQPEMLKLILMSKIEEDRRRTEEARLHIKELDLHQRGQKRRLSDSSNPNAIDIQSRTLPPLHPSLNAQAHIPFLHDQHTHDDLLSDWHQQRRRNSAATAMLAMGGSPLLGDAPDKPTSPRPLAHSAPLTYVSYFPVSPPNRPSSFSDRLHEAREGPAEEHHTGKATRRKRGSLAITNIVETKDASYYDNHVWKKNGSSTQKTGCRSTYYKCCNSSKGCEVNKTETPKRDGGFLIKYRGEHLEECHHVERISEI